MADPRMRSAAKRRGVEITSLSRPIKASDFRGFDLILAMDEHNKGRLMIAVIFLVDISLMKLLVCRGHIEGLQCVESQRQFPT